MKYPFLIDRTSTELFKFIIDSSDSDQVSKSLKDMVSDRQQLSKNIDILQGSINTIDLDIDNYKSILNNSKDVLEACDNIINLQSKISKLNQLKQIKETHINNLKLLEENKNKLIKIDIILNRDINIINQVTHKLNNLVKLNKLFINLHTIINNQSDNYEQLLNLNWINNIDKLDLSLIVNKLDKLKNIKQKLNNINQSLLYKPNLKLIELNLDNILISKFNRLKSVKQALNNIEYKQVENNTSIIATNNSFLYYNKFYDYFDVCPYCGNRIHSKKEI